MYTNDGLKCTHSFSCTLTALPFTFFPDNRKLIISSFTYIQLFYNAQLRQNYFLCRSHNGTVTGSTASIKGNWGRSLIILRGKLQKFSLNIYLSYNSVSHIYAALAFFSIQHRIQQHYNNIAILPQCCCTVMCCMNSNSHLAASSFRSCFFRVDFSTKK